MAKLMTAVVLLALAAPVALPAVFLWHRSLAGLVRRLLAGGRSHGAALIASVRKLAVHANKAVADSASRPADQTPVGDRL